jgi:alcohol dehydrogenase class IV
MVVKFNLLRSPRLIFGEGQLNELPSLLRGQDKNLLILTGKKSHLEIPSLAVVFAALEKAGFNCSFGKIESEPSPEDVNGIVSKHKDCQIIIAIGGGSVLDAGKAVSAMLPVEGSVNEYIEGVGTKKHNGIKRFFVAIPTTAGTGSEATCNAVLSETGIKGFKRSLRHENLVPDIAIIDPALATGCPPEITAASGLDAFTQLMESYLSVKANPYTDALALEGIRNVKTHLVNAVKNGGELASRLGMAFAAYLSGITLSNAGLGLTHGYASSIGGYFNIPHGTVCGTLMGAVNRYNIEMLIKSNNVSEATFKYITLGKLLSDQIDKSNEWYMKFVADYIDDLIDSFQIRRLREFGVLPGDFERIASITEHKANPVLFKKEQLIEILKKRL